MFRWGNPSVRTWVNRSQKGSLAVEEEAATYGGVARRTILLCALSMLVAIIVEGALWYSFLRPEVILENVQYWVYGLIGMGVVAVAWLIMHIVILFAPKTAKVLGPICCFVQGLFLGLTAFVFDLFVPGISLAALLGTGLVFLLVLLLYKRMEERIKNSFGRIFIIFLISYLVAQVAMVIASLAMNDWALFIIEAITSLLFIGLACFTVMWDIRNIDTLVQSGVDKAYEWVVAYALTTSLIYLYLQILEFLFRIATLLKSKK